MDRAQDERERITNDLVITPAEDELSTIARLANESRTADEILVAFNGSEPIRLPESLMDGLTRLAVYMAQDLTVAIRPYEATVTTQQAANLLGISRPYLIRLIEKEGAIKYQPGRRPGGHRRLKLSDVLEYRDQLGEKAIDSVGHDLEPSPATATGASAGGRS